MATLGLVTLECHRRHDLVSMDEPQITVDGITVWNGVMGARTRAVPGRRPECPVPPCPEGTCRLG